MLRHSAKPFFLSLRWKREGVRGARLGRDLTLIIALKIAALITIKLIWFSDAPDVTRADLARAVLEPPAPKHMDQR